MTNPIVMTRSGKLSGSARRNLEIFRGVPYGAAPRDALRWQAPQPVEAWQGVRSAEDWGASAPQSPAMMMLLRRLIGVALRDQSQDCLHLNIWTPATDDARRPVMVWIHGGAFLMGSGSTRIYDGASMARRGNVVVVTLNYRLGALGFLNLGEFFPGQASDNLGMRDQVAALEWVRDNIENFGGDPENVTIFGESAGGMSVGTLLGTPAANGLFHRAIAQSGAAHNVSSKDQASRVTECFLDELGVRDIGALERVAVSEIVAAQQRTTVRMGIRTGTLPWQPCVDGDLIPEQPLVAVAAGRGARVPLVVGTNRDEWKLFMLGDAAGRRLDEAALQARLEQILPSDEARSDTPDASGSNAGKAGNQAVALRAIHAYQGAGAGRGHETPTDTWIEIQSDRIFHHPAHRLAGLHSLHVAETYAYRFDWTPPLVGGAVGACHGIDIPFVFGTYGEPLLRPLFGLGRRVGRLSQQMMNTWCAFARSGDPNHGGLPEWPRYDLDERSTLAIGREPAVEPNPFGAALEFWSEVDPLSRQAEAEASQSKDGRPWHLRLAPREGS